MEKSDAAKKAAGTEIPEAKKPSADTASSSLKKKKKKKLNSEININDRFGYRYR